MLMLKIVLLRWKGHNNSIYVWNFQDNEMKQPNHKTT